MAKDQELLQAVKSNDLSAFRKLLAKIKAGKSKKGNKKYNVNIQDEDGFTTAHHVSLTGNTEILMSLLDMNCDVDVRDKKGMCPLHLAAWSGKVEIARLLVEAGADVNVSSDNGDTPLILACQHGNSDVADVLLDRGGDTTVVNKNGAGCLDLACRFGHIHVVEILLRSKEVKMTLSSSENKHTEPPLHSASKTGHVEIVRMLLEADADINQLTRNGSALHEAALYGKTAVVKLLLDWGIDVNARNDEGHTALDAVNLFTSSNASAEIKQLLKDAQAEEKTIHAKAIRDHFNMYDSTALHFKMGEIISVLEQSSSGRWKGKIQDGQKEKIGYFPSNCVKIITKRGSAVKKPYNDTGVVPMGTYEMVALPPVPPSPGLLSRNSPRMSSFGKKEPRVRSNESDDSSSIPPTKKHHSEPVPSVNGLKPKGSVKIAGHGLQYVEVAVEKPDPVVSSPTHTSAAKTQYAEVLLPGQDGSVQEVDENDEPPLLPGKQSRNVCPISTGGDVWVRNTATPPPTLPPKVAPQTTGATSDLQKQYAGPVRNHNGPTQSPQAATPELSRKGYEDMTFTPRVAAETPVVEEIWKQQLVTKRQHPRQPLTYENVNLPPRGKTPGELESVLISDVDGPGEGEDGYVIVNGPSHTTGLRGYENVNPTAKAPLRPPRENALNDEYYLSMNGRTEQQRYTSGPGDQGADTSETNSSGEGYETMATRTATVSPQYVNIKKHDHVQGAPSEAVAQVGLKMRDFNALYDWLESFKLSIYIDNFAKGGFDMNSVRGITTEDLTAVGVKKTGHRKKILAESAKLEPITSFPAEKPNDIMTWLQLIGLEQYIPEFLDGGFDDMEFVQDMTVEDLEAIGVSKVGHQRKIWMAVNALKSGNENENVIENKEEPETERKGCYLETSLDGEDSGVSTDEVDPAEFTSGSRQTEEIEAGNQRENTEDFSGASVGKDSRTEELENSKTSRADVALHENVECRKAVRTDCEARAAVDVKPAISEDLSCVQGEDERRRGSLEAVINMQGRTPFPSPPPRPPLPQEHVGTPNVVLNTNESQTWGPLPQKQTDIDSASRVVSVKDRVQKENSRIRAFTADSSVVRPKKPPPPVRPKSVKKEPPKVAPKPRKSASFSSYSERSSEEESPGDRSPTKSVDRRSSTGISSSGRPLRQGSSRYSRSDSSSSSVESLIEEFEERRKSFEMKGRKLSAPERLNMSNECNGNHRTEKVDSRADSDLDEQIKQILRRRSGDSGEFSSEPAGQSTIVYKQTGTESMETKERQKDKEMAEDLIKDINNMLSDFSTELDSMFD